MKRLIHRAALAVALVLASASGLAQQPIVIKFSHVVAVDTPKGKAAERFKQLAEERTNGRVKVEVYPNSQLYKDGEEVDALQLGAVQMLAPSTSKFGPLGLPQFELFDLPYIFPNREVLHRVTLGPLGRELFKSLEAKGIVGLGYWDNGFKVMSANKPLHMPADYKGLKMRIKSSKVLDAQMRALGVQPQVMAFSEVYLAMQTGRGRRLGEQPSQFPDSEVLRGAEVSRAHLPRLRRLRRHRQQEVLGRTAGRHPVDARQGDAGSDDVRERAFAQGERRGRRQDQGDGSRAGVRHHAGGAGGAQRKALLPVHSTMESRIGKQWIDAVYKEAAAMGVHY